MSHRFSTDLGFKLSIGVPLLASAAGAWYFSVYSLQTSSATMGPATASIPIATMADMFGSPSILVVSTFLLVWVVGMVAMMFPAMIPVMALYSKVITRGERESHFSRLAGLPLFLGGYLSIYALLGLILFAGVYAALHVGDALPWLSSFSVGGVSVVLFAAGVWQLTPLKDKSLSKCISPLGFLMNRAKKGLSGAFRMGAEHGIYCVGCCWLYMLVMLAVAAMSLIAMGLLSGLIIVEKVFLGKTSWFKWFSAGIFFFLASIVLAFPSYLALL